MVHESFNESHNATVVEMFLVGVGIKELRLIIIALRDKTSLNCLYEDIWQENIKNGWNLDLFEMINFQLTTFPESKYIHLNAEMVNDRAKNVQDSTLDET